MRVPSFDRVPLRWLTAAVVVVVVAAVLVAVVDRAVRRNDIAAELLSWTIGVGEIAIGLLVILAIVRHERRRPSRSPQLHL